MTDDDHLYPQDEDGSCVEDYDPEEDLKQVIGNTEDGPLKQALQDLLSHRENIANFYDDPMTEAMEVPTADFQHDFDKKERALGSKIMDLAKKGSEAYQIGWGCIDRHLP